MPFEKGRSGNPGGRPKAVARVVDLAQVQTENAIATLVRIMEDKKAGASARVAAANAILDRGWGKPAQPITGDEDNPLALISRIELVAPGMSRDRSPGSDTA